MSQSAPTDIDIGCFYTPQPVQRKFHASEARYPLLEAGRGGGKSTALLGDVSESFRYGVMSYASEQATRREVEIERELQKIGSNTQKYIRYLELTAKQANIGFTISRRRW